MSKEVTDIGGGGFRVTINFSVLINILLVLLNLGVSYSNFYTVEEIVARQQRPIQQQVTPTPTPNPVRPIRQQGNPQGSTAPLGSAAPTE